MGSQSAVGQYPVQLTDEVSHHPVSVPGGTLFFFNRSLVMGPGAKEIVLFPYRFRGHYGVLGCSLGTSDVLMDLKARVDGAF